MTKSFGMPMGPSVADLERHALEGFRRDVAVQMLRELVQKAPVITGSTEKELALDRKALVDEAMSYANQLVMTLAVSRDGFAVLVERALAATKADPDNPAWRPDPTAPALWAPQPPTDATVPKPEPEPEGGERPRTGRPGWLGEVSGIIATALESHGVGLIRAAPWEDMLVKIGRAVLEPKPPMSAIANIEDIITKTQQVSGFDSNHVPPRKWDGMLDAIDHVIKERR